MHTLTNTAADTAADTAAATSKPAQSAAVRVSLCGKAGAGRYFIIDRAVFDIVAARYGRRWFLLQNNGRDYVYTSGAAALRTGAHLHGKSNVLLLHRVVMDIVTGESPRTVWFRSENTTDLRARNLTTDKAATPSAMAACAKHGGDDGVSVEPYED